MLILVKSLFIFFIIIFFFGFLILTPIRLYKTYTNKVNFKKSLIYKNNLSKYINYLSEINDIEVGYIIEDTLGSSYYELSQNGTYCLKGTLSYDKYNEIFEKLSNQHDLYRVREKSLDKILE